MVASVFAVGFSCPADVIKSRMQNMQPGEYEGPVDCAKQMIRKEGLLSLYKGYTPAFIKLAPHTVISFIILDTLSQMILGKDTLWAVYHLVVIFLFHLHWKTFSCKTKSEMCTVFTEYYDITICKYYIYRNVLEWRYFFVITSGLPRIF